jgi:glycosyltransferase involved in cell wall biosynthesis
MDKQKISHLHVHFANPASTVSLITSKLFPISFSMTVHGPDEFYDVTLNNLPKKVREAEFVICISDYTQSQLMRISSVSEWDKFNVLPLGVDPDIFSPRFEPVRSGPCQILCVGRLVPSKGQHILLAAFAKLVNEGKNARLHLIGGGPDKLSLEKKIQELGIHKLVSINGALNPRQVVEAYQYADVFALSSFAEGLPIVLMEAMSMEIPCVATCINGIPELVRHNVEGLLVAPSNVEQLSQILELLIEDIELRKRLGKAGRQRILEKFNLEENVIRLYQLFKTHIPH